MQFNVADSDGQRLIEDARNEWDKRDQLSSLVPWILAERTEGSMELHRPDVPLIDRTKIQAEVLVPLLKAMEREFGVERTRDLAREALADEFRQLARDWVGEANGDRMAAFMRFAEYSNAEDPLDFESREAPEGELRFDVSSCQYARFFQEIGEPELGFLLVCSSDGPIAEGLGIGFERSQTLMQGGSHCDFRYILPPPGEDSALDP